MLSKFVQRCARAAGVEISRSTPMSDRSGWLLGFASSAGVTTIIDAGANTGQFGQTMTAAGWKRRLVSFEPLSAAHARLLETAARHPQWDVAPRTSIGVQRGVSGGRAPDRLR